MPLDADRLMRLEQPARQRRYAARDSILYALAVGMAARPADPRELRFVYEADLAAVPTMATTIGFDDGWLEAAGVDPTRLVHGAQHLSFHRPLPPEGWVAITSRISGVIDKGPGKGALILEETRLADARDGTAICTGTSTLFVRGGGGFGASIGSAQPAHPIPARQPDQILTVPTAANQAMIFRLLGDLNPLHVDPAFAHQAGFDRPILHGACTLGIACATLLRACCDFDPARLSEMEARFVGAVYPGEGLIVSLWQDRPVISFQIEVAGRADGRGPVVVLDNGRAVVAG